MSSKTKTTYKLPYSAHHRHRFSVPQHHRREEDLPAAALGHSRAGEVQKPSARLSTRCQLCRLRGRRNPCGNTRSFGRLDSAISRPRKAKLKSSTDGQQNRQDWRACTLLRRFDWFRQKIGTRLLLSVREVWCWSYDPLYINSEILVQGGPQQLERIGRVFLAEPKILRGVR